MKRIFLAGCFCNSSSILQFCCLENCVLPPVRKIRTQVLDCSDYKHLQVL